MTSHWILLPNTNIPWTYTEWSDMDDEDLYSRTLLLNVLELILQGGMLLPVYCTRTTWFVMVVEGNGRFEMACPHLGSQSQRQGRHYQKVQGSLSVGDVMIIRAGHPITVIATGDSELRMVGIGFNAHNNRMNFLAGMVLLSSFLYYLT